MKKNCFCRLLALVVGLVLLLSACTLKEKLASSGQAEDTSLTWNKWNGYDNFLELVAQTYPDINLEFTFYAGANATSYSWVQMCADDIADVFITSQILDKG